jgi:exopolysaccharide biosynthesis protein
LAGEWRPWWRSDSAPTRWSEPLDLVTRSVEWRVVAEGVELGELRLSGSGEAWRVRAILVRLDPRLVRFQLDSAFEDGILRAAWTIDKVPAKALVAFNAGQFTGSMPWGWVVLRGREFLPPGHGPLSTAVTVDTAGVLRWSPPDSIPSLRHARGIRAAFQSYPTLLEGDGDVPLALRPASHIAGVSLDHGDSRLAIGSLRDGRVLVALTRFDGLDGFLDAIPLGLTTPQTAALMGALGCSRAVMLDGGISSQLLVRDSTGGVQRWPGIRRVPLGLVAVARK